MRRSLHFVVRHQERRCAKPRRGGPSLTTLRSHLCVQAAAGPAPPNGFLFGELPLKPGESRQWEDWEYSYYPLMTSAVVIYALAWYYR